MKKFSIKVNGEIYLVEVEEIGGNPGFCAAPVAAPTVPVAAPPPAAAVPKPAAPVAGGGGGTVCAPMPGTILDVRVKVGDAVKPGDVLLLLEAMKMENELTADKAGTVKEVRVTKGQAVNSGDALVVIS